MSDFNQAVKWLREGKKVRRKEFPKGAWWDHEYGSLFCNVSAYNPKTITASIGNFIATDWEIYCEKHSWICQCESGKDCDIICRNCDIEKPKENSAEFLQRLGTDGQLWAKEFMKKFEEKKEEIDEELMRSWFANAIMAGHDKK